MRQYHIRDNLISIIKQLYNEARGAVIRNGRYGEWLHASTGVRHGCLLSLTLFNIFLETLKTDALGSNAGAINIGGRVITYL